MIRQIKVQMLPIIIPETSAQFMAQNKIYGIQNSLYFEMLYINHFLPTYSSLASFLKNHLLKKLRLFLSYG